VIARLAEGEKGSAGLVAWINTNWYPICILLYVGGIAALSANRFDALKTILTCMAQGDERTGIVGLPVIIPAMTAMTGIHDAFKGIPGHSDNYAPRSEYLFSTLQPHLDDLLFLGRAYEALFDRFEVFLALVFADINQTRRGDGRIWGPPGRFAWKHSRGYGTGPFEQLVSEAVTSGGNWGPVKAGLFAGSIDRFKEIADAYRQLVLSTRI
jgi:hypothetical protein